MKDMPTKIWQCVSLLELKPKTRDLREKKTPELAEVS